MKNRNDCDFLSNCHRYGLQRGYSLKITINTDIDSYLKSKQQKDKNAKYSLKQVSTFRYMTETKLIHQIEEWRNSLINADLNVITNTNKQLMFANCRMDILRKLDQIRIRISAIITRCNALQIVAKNKQKRKKKDAKQQKKDKPKLAATYVDVKTSLLNNQNQLQGKRKSLFKKLMPKQRRRTSVKSA